MKDGHCHSSVSQGGQISYSPVGRVASADGYLVALLDITVLEEDVYFLNLTCYVMKL